jgi:hypothetical protein
VQRQIPLPGFVSVAGPAEQTYLHLACEWRDEIAGVERGRPPPRRVDEIALAALLLAFEHGVGFSSAAWHDADRNTKSCQHAYLPWLDQLPWLLGHLSCSGASDRFAIRQLVGKLNHGNLSIRVWMMGVAWMIRGVLPREEVIYPITRKRPLDPDGSRHGFGIGRESLRFEGRVLAPSNELRARRLRGAVCGSARGIAELAVEPFTGRLLVFGKPPPLTYRRRGDEPEIVRCCLDLLWNRPKEVKRLTPSTPSGPFPV